LLQICEAGEHRLTYPCEAKFRKGRSFFGCKQCSPPVKLLQFVTFRTWCLNVASQEVNIRRGKCKKNAKPSWRFKVPYLLLPWLTWTSAKKANSLGGSMSLELCFHGWHGQVPKKGQFAWRFNVPWTLLPWLTWTIFAIFEVQCSLSFASMLNGDNSWHFFAFFEVQCYLSFASMVKGEMFWHSWHFSRFNVPYLSLRCLTGTIVGIFLHFSRFNVTCLLLRWLKETIFGIFGIFRGSMFLSFCFDG
jgi:hypothetical protein